MRGNGRCVPAHRHPCQPLASGRRLRRMGFATDAGTGAGRRRSDLRGGQPQECSRCNQRAVAEGHGEEGQDLLSSSAALQANRAGCPGADLHLSRPRLDGLSGRKAPDQVRHALQPAWQAHRAGRSQARPRRSRSSRGSGWPRFWVTDAWQWPMSMLSRPASTVRPR
jgi:hypothetical protein